MSAFTLLPCLLPFGSIAVPGLICSVETPHIDSFAPPLGDGKILHTNIQALKGLLSETNSVHLSAALTKLLNLDLTPRDVNSRINVESKVVGRYELLQQKATFAEICKSPAAREWIEDGIKEGQPSYMLVGAMTVFDASITQSETKEHKYGGSISVPVTEILEQGVDILDGFLDPSVSAKWSGGSTEKLSYSAKGEMVWAISFRRIKFRMFKKKSVATAYLESEIHWTPLAKQRSSSLADESEVLGVSLGLVNDFCVRADSPVLEDQDGVEGDDASLEDFDVVQYRKGRFLVPRSL